ncbi:MAG: trigger factor [Chloroflexi bacterium]|nr:trigger factor [Chloroflexota bacterium]
MKVSTTKLENCQAVLDVEVEPAELEKAMVEAYRHMVKQTAVPGFRPGKAPREVLERHVGKAVLEREAYNHFIPEAYEDALKQAGLEAIAEPDIEITKTEPLTFKATVALRPVVELGDYATIKLTEEPVSVSDEDVAKAVEKMRDDHATWEPMERPVEMNDLVTLNVQGKNGDRVILNQKGIQYDVDASAQFPVRGFSEQLVGMAKGEKKDFQLPTPDDHPVQTLRGKALDFHVEILEIKAKKISPLDDDFARTVDFPNLEALREKAAKDVKAKAEAEARRKLEESALDALVGVSRLEYPQILVEREIERMLRDRGAVPKDSHPDPALMEQLRPSVTERVRRSLVLEKFGEVEKITVSPEEIDAEVEKASKGSDERAAEVKKLFSSPSARRYLQDRLRSDKMLDRLVAIATGKAEKSANEEKSV